MKLNQENIRKITKVAIFSVTVFVIGGLGGVYFDQQILPIMRTSKFFSKIDFLKRVSENVTIINKTEQVTIKEDDSISEVSSQASNAVVNIISVPNKKPQTYIKNNDIKEKSGTGILVTGDGLIATYRSAINEQDSKYYVLLYNGNKYEAALRGIDNFTNIAFLKIEASNLTSMPIGDSSGVRPGKKLIGIGNSFGEYQNRYAAGIMSNFDKTFNLGAQTVSSSEKIEGVFSTDFQNKESYIGGPVVNYNGEMVGMVGAVVIDNKEKFFEIPSNIIKNSIDVALSGNLDQRPYLGVYYVSITREYSIANDLSLEKGALIYSPSGKQGLAIISGSPAEKAGLRIGDIILKINDKEININNPLSNILSQYKKGDSLEFLVNRQGEEIKIQVKL